MRDGWRTGPRCPGLRSGLVPDGFNAAAMIVILIWKANARRWGADRAGDSAFRAGLRIGPGARQCFQGCQALGTDPAEIVTDAAVTDDRAPVLFRQASRSPITRHGVRGGICRDECASDDLIVLGGEQHRQHVVGGCQGECAVVGVVERKIAEVAICIADQRAERGKQSHLFQCACIDHAVVAQSRGRRDPIIQLSVRGGGGRFKLCGVFCDRRKPTP